MADIASTLWADPAEGWHCRDVVHVYCTAEIEPSLLNDFLLHADQRTYDGRPFFLCLVRSAEIRKYQPEGKAVSNFYKGKGLYFVYQNDLAPRINPSLELPPAINGAPAQSAPPVKSSHLTPASLFHVSLELDEHTVVDKKTCLLRKNGRNNRHAYAEVRCDFSIAMDAAISLRKRKVSIIQLQSEAALYGGAVPSKKRKAARLGYKGPCTSYRLTIPEDSTIWNHNSSPCPVFVIENIPNNIVSAFVDAVNLPVKDADYAIRVMPVDINVETNAESYFHSKPEPSIRASYFLDISMAKICSFVRHHLASGHLSNKYFIVLDGLDVPRRHPKHKIPDHLSDLTCLIGDAFICDNKGQPLLIRCSYDSCITILDHLKRGGRAVSLRTYANDAAVDYGGCIEYPISRDTSVEVLEPLASIPRMRSYGADEYLTAPPDTTTGAGSPTIVVDKDPAQIKMTQLLQTPGAQKVKREEKPERDRSVSPDFHYDVLFPHSQAFGASQIPTHDGVLSNLSGLEQELISTYGTTSPILEGVDVSTPEAAKGDEHQGNRVESFLLAQNGSESDVDDDFYDIRLPEVTGLTQMD